MTRGHESADAPGGGGRLPDFIVIGAMRAGSTSLARYLGAHPGVSMPAKKELHFFDWNWERGVEWYRSRFAGAAPGTRAGEATPIYVVYREAMERMAATIPDVRLIAVLRNPVDRAYSHYMYNRMLGFEQLPFEDALAKEPARPARVTDRRTFDYTARGRYLAQLEQVCDLFPRSALHVLVFEDLVTRPAETYRDVLRFLGLDDGFTPTNLGEPMNSHAEYRSKLVAKAARAMPSGLQRAMRRFNRVETAYEPMRPETRRGLDRRFAPENAALAAWLGRDLSVWAAEAATPLARTE